MDEETIQKKGEKSMNTTKCNKTVLAGQLGDFGEKIGGARKDLWKDRGLYAADLDAMNDREAEKFVKKDNIWKKPDYQAMIDEGIPLGVVYFIKKTRDALNASPQYYHDDALEKRLARQKEYVRTVRELQEAVSGVRGPMTVSLLGTGIWSKCRVGAAASITMQPKKDRKILPSQISCPML